MEIDQLSGVLVALGCPADKAPEMARQLYKRAEQLAIRDGEPVEQALAHLLGLMRQGWAANSGGQG